jgi:hypothetical protein
MKRFLKWMADMNYEKDNKERRPREHYKPLYAALDPAEASLRCGVEFDKEKSAFFITFMGAKYEVKHPEFSVSSAEPQDGFLTLTALPEAQLLIMRYLIEGRFVENKGGFLTFREVPWGTIYTAQFDGRCIKRLAFGFGSKPEALKKAMDKIGAKALKIGDFAYEFELMPGLKMQFILWQGDDEFPPSSQILFSDNFPLAFTAEDMAVIGDVSITTTKALSA